MGWCIEFGGDINASCEHVMLPGSDSCACEACGTTCAGLYDGCAGVWARGPRESYPVKLGTSASVTRAVPADIAGTDGELRLTGGGTDSSHAHGSLISAAKAGSGVRDITSEIFAAIREMHVASTGRLERATELLAAVESRSESMESALAQIEGLDRIGEVIVSVESRLASLQARLAEVEHLGDVDHRLERVEQQLSDVANRTTSLDELLKTWIGRVDGEARRREARAAAFVRDAVNDLDIAGHADAAARAAAETDSRLAEAQRAIASLTEQLTERARLRSALARRTGS